MNKIEEIVKIKDEVGKLPEQENQALAYSLIAVAISLVHLADIVEKCLSDTIWAIKDRR